MVKSDPVYGEEYDFDQGDYDDFDGDDVLDLIENFFHNIDVDLEDWGGDS